MSLRRRLLPYGVPTPLVGRVLRTWKSPARLLLPLLVVPLVAVTACGVDTDREPRTMGMEAVPADLLEAPTSEATAAPEVGGDPFLVYLIDRKGSLVLVERLLRPPVLAPKLVEALFAGPDRVDESGGLTTSITADTTLLGIDGPINGTLTVDLSDDLLDVEGRRQIQALAQVVYTVTGLPGVERVRLEFDGRRREIPRGDGDLTSAAVTRNDYANLAPDVPALTQTPAR